VRKILTYIVYLMAACAAGFLLLEGAVRLFGPDDLMMQTYDPDVLDMRDGNFLYVNRAGYRGVVRGAEISVNSQHLLGPELANDGRPRLMLLGDSVIFAACFEFEDTPGPVLERMLDGRYAVMNAGCIGYTTEHELAYLHEFGDSLRPALVVLGYCLNDPMSPKAANLVGVAEAREKKWGRGLLTLNLFLRKHSLFFVWLKGALRVETRQNGYATSIAPMYDDESWGRNREALRDIHAWCRARGIPFVLVIFPHREQYEIGESALLPQKRLHEMASEFPVVDLTAALEPEDFLYGDPLHFDRDGIRKSMAVIAGAVKDLDASTQSRTR
jgi:hypothetical protein